MVVCLFPEVIAKTCSFAQIESNETDFQDLKFEAQFFKNFVQISFRAKQIYFAVITFQTRAKPYLALTLVIRHLSEISESAIFHRFWWVVLIPEWAVIVLSDQKFDLSCIFLSHCPSIVLFFVSLTCQRPCEALNRAVSWSAKCDEVKSKTTDLFISKKNMPNNSQNEPFFFQTAKNSMTIQIQKTLHRF